MPDYKKLNTGETDEDETSSQDSDKSSKSSSTIKNIFSRFFNKGYQEVNKNDDLTDDEDNSLKP